MSIIEEERINIILNRRYKVHTSECFRDKWFNVRYCSVNKSIDDIDIERDYVIVLIENHNLIDSLNESIGFRTHEIIHNPSILHRFNFKVDDCKNRF